jgi:small subunit ribosomal protein S6
MAEKEKKKKTTVTKMKAPPKSDEGKQYEAMFLFPPPGVTDVEGMVKIAQGIIERHGGKIQLIKKWDERKLAYEVKKQKRGTYIVAFYKGPGASVGAIERDVNLSEEVLRVLVTQADHLNEAEMAKVEPQPIQPREERAPWDRPDFNRPPGRGGDRPPRRDEGVPAEAGMGAEKE